jgi:hypothetical protein
MCDVAVAVVVKHKLGQAYQWLKMISVRVIVLSKLTKWFITKCTNDDLFASDYLKLDHILLLLIQYMHVFYLRSVESKIWLISPG